jgi:UDP-2,4-diacetamido-2,4,6-trideoxy-beta-L-altropyranose hydrolase
VRPLIGIRANGGPRIGFGHLRRCLSLAEALIDHGAGVLLIVNPESGASERARPPALTVALLPEDEAAQLDQTAAIIATRDVRALVVDSYLMSAPAIDAIRVPVAAIVDGPPAQAMNLALLINTAAGASPAEYRMAATTAALFGPTFALLDPRFAALPAREIPEDVRRVLVTAGGGDPDGVSLVMLAATAAALPGAQIDVVVGPYFPDAVAAELCRIAAGDRRVRVTGPLLDLHDLVTTVDLAVIGGGQTAYELAAAGTPACAVRMAINQPGSLESMSGAGTLTWVGDAGDAELTARLSAAVHELASDVERRREMSRRGRCLVDGRGAQRVASEVLRLCA